MITRRISVRELLLDRHGAAAPIQAAMRVDELDAAGDWAGRRAWMAILAAIDESADGGRPPKPCSSPNEGTALPWVSWTNLTVPLTLPL